MKKMSLCVISGMVLSLLMTVQTFGAELSGEVEANYRAMGMTEAEIMSVKNELSDVDEMCIRDSYWPLWRCKKDYKRVLERKIRKWSYICKKYNWSP